MSAGLDTKSRRVTQKIRRGAKLLCIDDTNICRRYTPHPPVRNHLYCVREVYEDHGQTGVLLLGIEGPWHAGLEQGFLLSRFRWVRN